MRTIHRGVTLVELMVVIVIIAVLAGIAYPSYQDSVISGRRTATMGDLQSFAQAMERHFTANDTYLGAAAGGADTGAPGIFPTEAPVDSGTKFYDLTINAATATTYTLRATPKGAQAGDGIIELDATGARRWDENNNGAFDATENDWERN